MTEVFYSYFLINSMSITSTDNKKDLVIQLLKEGKNMREISKVAHLSFSTIGKILRESKGIIESKPEKSITSKAFQLFEKRMSLVEVAIELDLSPEQAEDIHQGYLRLKGLYEISRYCQRMKKHLSSFMEFVNTCEEQTPESQKLLDILNLGKVIEGQREQRTSIRIWCRTQELRIDELKEEEEAIKQRIEKLKQEEYNKWYELFGNGKYNSIGDDSEQ